jgi:hypothetical protein
MNGQHQQDNDASGAPAVAPNLLASLDAYGVRHPKLLLATTLLAAIVATLALLAQTQGAAVLYQAF